SRRRHTRSKRDWSSDVCSSDLVSMLFTLEVYEQQNSKRPFDDWLNGQEQTIRYMILAKLRRVSLGNFGINKPVGNGVYEIKIDKIGRASCRERVKKQVEGRL